MQGVEYRRLWIGQERHAHKNIRIPQRDFAITQGRGGKVAIGIEVEQNIPAGQHPIGKDQRIVEQPNKERQRQRRAPSGPWLQ